MVKTLHRMVRCTRRNIKMCGEWKFKSSDLLSIFQIIISKIASVYNGFYYTYDHDINYSNIYNNDGYNNDWHYFILTLQELN